MRIIVFSILTSCCLLACNPITERLAGYEVHGVDVSHYQMQVDWDTLLTQNIDFVFIKATEGESLQDSLFIKNWEALGRRDVIRGAYHFFHPSVSIEGQFQNFTKRVKLESLDLPPVVDIEVTNGESATNIRDALKQILLKLEAHYKIKPIIYTNQKLYNEYLQNAFSEYPLWIARYNTIEPELIDGHHWTFWQYGNRGQLRGVVGDIDFNVFNGSLDSLKHLTIPALDDSISITSTERE